MPKINKSFKTSERWKYQLKTSRANRLILKIILGKLLLYNTQFLILGFILENHPHTLKPLVDKVKASEGKAEHNEQLFQ